MQHSNTELLTENPSKHRISSIDLVRGFVMIIMALDHTRDFTHIEYWSYRPEDLEHTSPAIFFTRWITHFCAPAFVLLSGTSAYLTSLSRTKKETAVFLLTRGLWLILLEITIVRFGIFFNLYYDFILLQVIWAIGICMVFMAGLIFLSSRTILFGGLIIIFGHNLLDQIILQPQNPLYALWALLHQSAPLTITHDKTIYVAYPFLPWLGVMMVGFCLGKLYQPDFDAIERKSILKKLGIGSILLFLLLRGINYYGDPAPWSQQKDLVFTILSFLNTSKYPPSLLYLLMTLGPILLILSLVEFVNAKKWKPVIVYGRVPLFYYLIHWFLIHLTALTLALIHTGKSFGDLNFHFGQDNFGGIPKGVGYSLPWVYLIWLCIVVVMYPLCNWYNNYKSRNKRRWLSYL